MSKKAKRELAHEKRMKEQREKSRLKVERVAAHEARVAANRFRREQMMAEQPGEASLSKREKRRARRMAEREVRTAQS